VNKRAITLLLAAFLALSAGAAVPAARAGLGEANSAIVWIAQERSEQQVQAKTVAPCERHKVTLAGQPPAIARYFAASLYQRPPPFLR
jgi:hypothetical protein